MNNARMAKLQKILERIYMWVSDHRMVVKGDKTEMLQFGKIPIKDKNYTTPEESKIKTVEKCKDLGVWFEASGGWKIHIQ